MFHIQSSPGAVLRVFVMLVIAGFCLGASPAAAQNAATEADKAFQKYADDWNAGDIESVFAFLADDIVQIPADGTVIVGKTLLEVEWRKHLSEYKDEWKPTVTDVAVSGRMAYLKGRFTEKRTPKDGGPSQTMTADAVWAMRREDSGEWKLVLETWFGKGWE